VKVRLEDYDSPVANAWCPGCGNFGILAALKRALVELELAPHQILMVSGIGQAPKLPHYLRGNTFNGLHGREVASASGAKLAASDLTVLVHAGDGGAYGEGGNHFLHAIRRNIDITLVVHDNHIYGLTKGQASPTTDQGSKVVLQPRGVAVRPMNPLALAVSQSCAFVAQALASRTDQLVDLLKQAIGHAGFSFINVLQPCVSWDKVHTFKYYDERCFDLGKDHDPADQAAASKLVLESDQSFPLGLIFTAPRPSYQEVVLEGIAHPLRDRGVDPKAAERLFQRFR